MGIINCSRCEKSFYKQNKYINENLKLGHKSYCSLACQSLYKIKQRQLICDSPKCNKTLRRVESQISFRNFCSKACAGVVIGPLNGLKHKKFRYCDYCGNRVSGKRIYCSTKCWGKAHQHTKETLINASYEIPDRYK